MTLQHSTESTDSHIIVTIGSEGQAATSDHGERRHTFALFDLDGFVPPNYEEETVVVRNSDGHAKRKRTSWTLTDAEITVRGYHAELVAAAGQLREAGGKITNPGLPTAARANAGIPIFDIREFYDDEQTGEIEIERHQIIGRIVGRASVARRQGQVSTMTFTVKVLTTYAHSGNSFAAGATVTQPSVTKEDADEYYDLPNKEIWKGGWPEHQAKKTALGIS